jgi:hypothetical protein
MMLVVGYISVTRNNTGFTGVETQRVLNNIVRSCSLTVQTVSGFDTFAG